MSSCIKIRLQNIIPVFLSLLFINLNANCQVQELIPEINLDAGLQSNAVRVVRVDNESRLWVGTDNGLNVFNATLAAQKNVVSVIANQSVWDIAFTDSLLFIGTRYDGLYIFNKRTGVLFEHFPASNINLIRKVKVFNNGIFILTNNKTYKWVKDALIELPLKTNLKVDFITDIFSWNQHLYCTTYPLGYIFQYSKNSFGNECTLDFLPKGIDTRALLCAKSSGNTLVLGGDKFYIVLQAHKKPKEFKIPQTKRSNYAVWDIAFINHEILLALGETLSNQKGFLYQHNVGFKANRIIETGFLTSFAIDSVNNCLYYGSLTKGLYLEKGIFQKRFINSFASTKFMANTN